MRKNPYANTPMEEQPRPDADLLKSKIMEKLPSAAPAEQPPVVTVVTAVFNAVKAGRKEELLQCMDSVQAQTGVAVEHLVIDGASSDGTIDLIKNYQNKNVPIRLLSEPDSGIYDAMNRGLWLARGKYVIFLNSDDYYSNSSGLAESVKALEESGADFSYAPICVLSETTGLPVEHLLTHPDVNLIFLEMPFSHQSMMIRREAMLEINGFDLRYSSGADYDSVLRLIFTNHRACFVPVCFVSFRLGGYSFVNMGQSQREVGTIFSRLYKKYLDVDISPEDGTKIYVTKQGPKELRQRQFRYAVAAFGNAIGAFHKEDENPIPEDLLMLRYRLQTIKNRPGIPAVIRILARMMISSPVLFFRFFMIYLRLRGKSDSIGAGKLAYLELVAEYQKNRKTSEFPQKQNNTPSSVPPLSPLGVTHQDYWCTNGVYMGESWGSWTGRKFSTFFNLPENYIRQPLKAKIYIGGYVFPQSPKRVVDIMTGNRKIGSLTLDNMMPLPYQFTIPADCTASAVLDIDFIVDSVFVPKTLGLGEDTRELGMTFQKLLIFKEDSSAEVLPAGKELTEIRVGFLNHYNKWWVGGITYFKNLFQAMETTESPRLKPFIFRSPDKLADCLLPYVSIFSDPPPSPADLDHIPTASEYHVDVLSHLNGNQVSEGRDGIAWIADFQHIHLPEMFDEKEIAFRNHSFHTLIDQNRIVCLSSYDAMEDFRKYAPEAAGKARCLHFVSIPDPGLYPLPEQEAAEVRRKRQLPERYFYVPNQFWKHKNHITVLRAVALLKKAGHSIHVVFSGNTFDARFPHYFEELQTFCHQEQIEENVHFLGLIPLKEVYFLMRDCLAIINPSRFEGWSSSVEEAKSIGKTIFLSNLNVHYEQMPPQGTYFPCDDPEWLADLLKRAWLELKPGPDPVMEAKAKQQLPLRIREFGRDFQQIVLDAVENKNSCMTVLQSLPDVTVVTVCNLKNEEQKQQMLCNLESVAAQKDVSAEHLIVNCGTSDDALEFLKPYVEKYGCKVISEPVHGVYGAMNLGIIQAKGKYVSCLKPGDRYVSDHFLKDSFAALEKGSFDFSYSADSDEADCFLKMPFCHSSMLFLRKALCSVACYNDTFCCAGEYDLLLRLIFSGKKGIRVERDGVNCTVPQENTEIVQREYGLIFSRLYSRLGYAVTPEEGLQLCIGKTLPEKLRVLLGPYCAHTFAASRPDLSLRWKTETQETEISPELFPQVSVILPLEGEVRFLEERIASIRSQTFRSYEVIIVDAGLPEECMAPVKNWAAEDARVHLFHENGNLWNYGVTQAKGKYLYFALCDQTMSPDCLEHMAAALNNHPECSICDTRLQLIDQQGKPVSDVNEFQRYFGHLSYPADQEHVRLAPYDFFHALCGKKIYTSLGQIMFRKEFFPLTGTFPENAGNAADYLWELRASFHCNTVYLPEYLTSMRLNPDALYGTDGVRWNFNEMYQCVKQVLCEMPESHTKTAACGLATLLHFKEMLLPLKQTVSLWKKLSICLKAVTTYPRKSVQIVFFMLKFSLQKKGGSVSIRANNALIASRMKQYRQLIRNGSDLKQ